MLAEYLEDKKALMSALEQTDANLHANVATYALLETEDPAHPFELKLVQEAGKETAQAKLMNERLFDRGFLDFGFKEVRGEDNLEGIVYSPIEELIVDNTCIGVAPVTFFDADSARVRMAHGADEEEPSEDNPDSLRFLHFLNLLRGSCIDGSPAESLKAEDAASVCGLVFKFTTGAPSGCIIAFQRTQRMWIQQKSSYLIFDEDGAPEAFSGKSIKLGNGFDFLLYADNLYFRNLKALELLFKFNRLSSQAAKDYADTLDPILADFEKIDECIEASRGVANKLIKIQKDGSAVAEMSADELQYRANRIAYYSRKLKFNEDGKVMLTTNKEVRDFLRMLNDTYLVSPLTQSAFEVNSKKPLEPGE